MILRSRPLRALLSLAPLTAAILAWGSPHIADACSCFPWIDVRWPTADAVVHANDLILVNASCGGQVSDLSVTVDGQPAALRTDPDRIMAEGLRIVPEPSAGAQVRIEGCAGGGECADDVFSEGNRVVLEFTVDERDEVPPAPPQLLALDYELEPEAFGPGCSIEEEPRPARDWTLELEGQEPAEDLVYHLTLGPRGGDVSRRTVVADGLEELEITMRRFQEDAGQDVCATVRTFDMAGNEAESVETCTELGRRETLDGSGCACTTAPASRSGWAGAGLMLLLGGWARRRRSTQPAPR